MRIYKYGLLDFPEFFVDLPKGAKPLSLQMQNGIPTLWAHVDPKAPLVKRKIFCVWTGENTPAHTDYLGTIQKGDLALHYFIENVL